MISNDTIYIIKPKLRDGFLTYRKAPDGNLIWKTFPSIQNINWYGVKWGFNVEHLNTKGGD